MQALDRELRAEYVRELADVQRADRWRAEHAGWAERKKQRHEKMEAGERAEVARIELRVIELRGLLRDAARIRKAGASAQLPPPIVEISGGRLFVRVRNTGRREIKVSVARLSMPPESRFCAMYPQAHPHSSLELFPIAPGESAKFLHSQLSYDCPQVMNDNAPVLLDIREGTALRWASPHMLDRIVEETKEELEKLEQPRPRLSKVGPAL